MSNEFLDPDKLVSLYDALMAAINDQLYKNKIKISHDHKRLIIQLNLVNLKRQLDEVIELDKLHEVGVG